MSCREDVLSVIEKIPSLPPSANDVIRTLKDPDASMKDVSKTIEFDPNLTTNVLKLANSAYYGLPREVGSVREAAIRLGTNKIFQLVIASSVSSLAKKEILGYDLPPGELWTHSVAVAIGTEAIADALGVKIPNYAFTAALLHDIGKVVLGTFVKVEVEEIMSLAYEKRLSFDEAERVALGIDHAEAGALLLEVWKLPRGIIHSVRWHHQPDLDEEMSPLVDMIHISDNLCRMSGIGAGADALHYRPSERVREKYTLKPRVTEPVVLKIICGLDDFRDWFKS